MNKGVMMILVLLIACSAPAIKGPSLPAIHDVANYSVGMPAHWTVHDSSGAIHHEFFGDPLELAMSSFKVKGPFTIVADVDGRRVSKQIMPTSFTKIPSGRAIIGDNRVLEMTFGRGNGGLQPATQDDVGWSNEAMFFDEAPMHEVDVTAFEIMTYEATQEEYALFLNDTKHRTPKWHEGVTPDIPELYTRFKPWVITADGTRIPPQGEELYPANLVTFDDCREFAKWAGYRLPTEYEWEYAARGPEGLDYPYGNTFDPNASNMAWEGHPRTHGPEKVGARPKDLSPFGVYDMAGNVMEWVEDDYQSYPGSSHEFKDTRFAINRGGSWGYHGYDQMAWSRFVFAAGDDPSSRWHDIGCRLARDAS